MRLTVASSSLAVRSAIGRLPSYGKTSFSSRSMIRLACNSTHVADCLACHSRATTSKLFAARSSPAALAALRCSPGSTPAASSLRAASRLSRASFSPVSGYAPSASRFSLPRGDTSTARACHRPGRPPGTARQRQTGLRLGGRLGGADRRVAQGHGGILYARKGACPRSCPPEKAGLQWMPPDRVGHKKGRNLCCC